MTNYHYDLYLNYRGNDIFKCVNTSVETTLGWSSYLSLEGILMLYKILLNYFRAKLLRVIVSSFLSKKGKTPKNLKKLSLIEYGLELVNIYLMESKKNKSSVKYRKSTK